MRADSSSFCEPTINFRVCNGKRGRVSLAFERHSNVPKVTVKAVRPEARGCKCSEEKMDWNVLMQCRIFPECSLWTILDVPE